MDRSSSSQKVKPKQFSIVQRESLAYGGKLLNTRKGRAHGRPLSTRESMHLVMRSSQARGTWSLRKGANPARIKTIFDRFANKYGVRICRMANVGNHLHLRVQLSFRDGYKPFIRATSGAIAMVVTGAGRGQKLAAKFWDYRPFTRVVRGRRAERALDDYIRINQLEGAGRRREEAEMIVELGWFDSRDLSST